MIPSEHRPDHPDAVRQGALGTVAVLLLASIGQIASYITPFTMTALMRGYDLQQGRASIAISVEVLVLAAALFLTPRLIVRIEPRMLAFGGAAVAMVGQLLTVFGENYPVLIVARTMCGVGAGCAMAVAYAVISASPSPARLFTIQSVFLGGVVLAVFLLIPGLQSTAGPRGQFLALALMLAAAAPMSLAMRAPLLHADSRPAGQAKRAALFWVLAAAVAFCGMGANAIWLHFETLGELRGLSFAVLVTVTTVSGVLMIVAPVIALWLYRQVGGFTPFLGGCALQGAVVTINLMVDSGPVFVVCGLILNLIIVVLLVYARILAAEVDDTGSLAAGVGGADFVGGFTGPLLGGLFFVSATANGGFVAAILTAFALSMGFALFGARLITRQRQDTNMAGGY